jgi:hypothetical protein
MAPNAVGYAQQGESGSWGEAASGLGISLWNGVKGLGNYFWQDTLMGAGSGTFYPSPFEMTPVSNRELGGAAVGDMVMLAPVALKGLGVLSREVKAESGLATAFRVEGGANQRIAIDVAGNVSVHGDNMLFLSFDQTRSESFLARRVDQFGDGTLKSFQVPQSFLGSLRANSVLESEAHMFPNSPLRVDLRYSDQFGLRSEQINTLRDVIVQGSGQ